MESTKYKELRQRDQETEERAESSLDGHVRERQRSRLITLLLSLGLILSLCGNAFLWGRNQITQNFGSGLSKYAKLARDVPVMRVRNTLYDSTDRAVQDAAWEADALKPENGFLALDDTYSESIGLPHAQRWPWSDKKGVYILASSHDLHCVHVLRQVTNEAYDNATLTWTYGHVMHCLNVLRESVMCNADDEPLYTGPLHAQTNEPNPRAGIGFNRMCRNWDKLQAWGRAHSACWRPLNVFNATFPETERYKFCPDGSTPWRLQE